MIEDIIENHKRYNSRIDLFQSFGYDIAKERDFIIEKALPIQGKILELGTGKGYFTVALVQKGYHCTTVDISKEEQSFAQMNIKYLGLETQVNFVIENAEHLGFRDKSYDIAFTINVIHHLAQPFKVVDELLRVVSHEGKIILSDFSEKGFETVNRIHMSEGRQHSKGEYDLNDIEDYLLKRNYRIEKFNTDCQELMIIYKGGTR